MIDQTIVCPLLIGRDSSMAVMRRTLQRVRSAGSATLLVSGEAGVGKSRLLRKTIEEARADGFLVLSGASFEADNALPFAPLLDLVRTFASVTSPAVVAHALEPAGSELVALFPELQSVFTDITPAPPTDPEHGRRRLFDALLLAIRQLARSQPLLLVFEDVHWSDDASLDLLLHLARGASTQPVALALSFRPEESGPALRRLLSDLDRTRSVVDLSLHRLGAADVQHMLRAIFGDDGAPDPAFASLLHELTDGNPFFVEEVLKALVVAGDLLRGSDGLWRARPLERMHVPRSAVDAVRRRLSQLSREARELASLAAVAGRRFDFALLQSLSGHDEPTLLVSVRELVDAQLVVEESAERIAFRHALTREAIYTELLTRERVALHRRIAAALEAQYEGAHDAVVETLAYHTFQAEEWEKARMYGRRAAEHALALFAPREALAHLDRAVHATVRAGVEVEASLHHARGRALETLGEFESAHAAFMEVLAGARDSSDAVAEWDALHALGMLWAARDYARAGEYRQQALALARRTADNARIARSLNRIGNWYLNLEQPERAKRYHSEALQLMTALGDERGIAETVDLVAMTSHIAGEEVDAAIGYGNAVTLFSALGNRRGLAAAEALRALCGPSHHCSAGVFAASDGVDDVLATLRPVELTHEIGWRAGESFCRMVLADCLAWRGAHDRARPLARRALAIAEDLDHLEWQAASCRVLGQIELDLFAVDSALALLGRAHTIAQRLGSRTWTRWCAAPLAIALARSGRIDSAFAVLDDAAAHATMVLAGDEAEVAHVATLGERHLQLARVEVLLAARRPDEALTLLDECTRDVLHHARSIDVRSSVRGPHGVPALPRHSYLRGHALVALGRLDDAERAFILAADEAAAASAEPLRWRAHAALGQLHRSRRQRVATRAAFDAARGIAERIASTIEDIAARDVFLRGVDDLAPPPPRPSPRQAARAAHGGLTRRERQVALLVAEGKSNRAVARALGISERTAEDHVANCIAKLQFTSRAQLAAWAVLQGLPDTTAT